MASLGVRNLVFSEAGQAIYEVDDLAAFVWRSLEDGLDPEQIVDELVETGVARRQATDVIAGLKKLGDLDRSAPPPNSVAPGPAQMQRAARLTLLISGVAVQLHLSRTLLLEAQSAFGHLSTDAQSEVQLCARAAGRSVHFLSAHRPEWSCERSHFIPVLKAELIDQVLRRAHYEVALHAAAVAQGDGMILLVGSPGAGKTTLCLALASAGFEAVSDDVVLLDQAGYASGLPFPLTCKAPAWPLISRAWPGVMFEPSYERPDGQTVAYLDQIPMAFSPPRRIKSLILLNRQEHAQARIEHVDPIAVLSTLIDEGATRDERLSATGFKSLVAVLQEARCCRLTYSNLPDAIEAVRGFNH